MENKHSGINTTNHGMKALIMSSPTDRIQVGILGNSVRIGAHTSACQNLKVRIKIALAADQVQLAGTTVDHPDVGLISRLRQKAAGLFAEGRARGMGHTVRAAASGGLRIRGILTTLMRRLLGFGGGIFNLDGSGGSHDRQNRCWARRSFTGLTPEST